MTRTNRLSAQPLDLMLLAALAAALFPLVYGGHPGEGIGHWIAAAVAAAAGLSLVPASVGLAHGRVDVLRVGLAVASAAAASVHFAVISDHVEEWWLFGAFFALAALAQLAFAMLVLVRPAVAVYVAGALGNAAIAVVWIVSRTIGLPIGPNTGEAEAVGVADVVSTVLELAIVAGCVVMLVRPVGIRVGRTGLALLLAAGLAPTTGALAAGTTGHPADHGEHAEHGVAAPSVAAAPAARKTLMLGGRAGDVLVGLSARRGGPVEIHAIPPDLSRLPSDAVLARAGSVDLQPIGCGANCFRFSADVLAGARTTLTVDVTRNGRVFHARFELPPRMPAPAARLFAGVAQRMAAVRTLQVHETIETGRLAFRATFEFQAPNRMRYRASDGSRAIVIGPRRWDAVAGMPWEEAATNPIRTPAYMWEGAGASRLLGSTRLGGRRVRVLGLFRPDMRYPAWFRVYVARDLRVVRAEMLAPGHFMLDRLSRFDAPLTITPPRS